MRETIIPSYLYQQYYDDDNLQAFVSAYNQLAQNYLNTFNTLNLPIYTSDTITGALLDWVANGLYGIQRPSLSEARDFSGLGVYNTIPYNTEAYSRDIQSSPAGFYVVDDDFYKRIITWNFFKGDGFQYNTTWLKRRVQRFLYGVNGIYPQVEETYTISITYTAPNIITIDVPALDASPILNSAIQSGALALPFNYEYVVTY